MTAAEYEYETDEERDAREADEAAEAQRRGADPNAAARRRAEKERDNALRENGELKAKNAAYERRDALDKAKSELAAEGPLAAFLRTYDGEPTADAIRQAVTADPDFAPLVTFPPDPRDEAARIQDRNARNIANGQAPSGQIAPGDVKTWAMDEQIRFKETHPEAWESLLRGTTIPAPAGWA